MGRKIYIVRTGNLHPTTNTFWFTNYYVTSLKKANRLRQEILDVNKAENIQEQEVFKPTQYAHKGDISMVDYVTEGNKARILVEFDELG